MTADCADSADEMGQIEGISLDVKVQPDSFTPMNENENPVCRSAFVDAFTTVQLSNGMVVSLGTAKEMGLLPPDATPGS